MMMTQTVCDVRRSESCGDLSYAPLNHYAAGTGSQIVRQATSYKASLLRRGLFRLSGRLGNGERETKRAGAGEKENESAGSSHRPPHAPQFFDFPVFSLYSPFSRCFPTEGVSAEERGTKPYAQLFAILTIKATKSRDL